MPSVTNLWIVTAAGARTAAARMLSVDANILPAVLVDPVRRGQLGGVGMVVVVISVTVAPLSSSFLSS